MKRLSFIICSMLMVVGSSMITSCGDNTDFWGAHILTDDEIAEMKRQDSIKEAQRNTINADLVLEYTAEVTISSTSYDGVSVPIDCDKIAELFGISKEVRFLFRRWAADVRRPNGCRFLKKTGEVYQRFYVLER